MHAPPTFRPATKADAASLAVLVDIAGEGDDGLHVEHAESAGTVCARIRPRAGRPREGGFSWRNAVVAEVDREVAATLVGYPLDDPYDLGILDEMPEIVRPLVKLEAKAPGSWYLNVLATFPEFRRRGIGAELLAIAEHKANETRARSLSVIVGSWNECAARLYRRAGYSPLASAPAILFPGCPHNGDWVLMLRSLVGNA
jgi:ribosomal protein S18 acetylase RimI-like enzyme